MEREFVDEFEASLIDDISNSEFHSNNAVYETLGIVPDSRRLPPRKNLSATFALPEVDEENEFEQRVQEQCLCLENVECTQEGVRVTVRVANNGDDKTVKIRYTRNNWRTFEDVCGQAIEKELDQQSESSGISISASDKTDDVGAGPRAPTTAKIIFELAVSRDFGIGSRLEFAIYCETGGRTIWDNNNGQNYAIECFTKDLNPGHVESDKWWHHFM
ncbi:protein phosphatase 1 regulatory subunit 3D-like [Saccoglossus kowalevskii]